MCFSITCPNWWTLLKLCVDKFGGEGLGWVNLPVLFLIPPQIYYLSGIMQLPFLAYKWFLNTMILKYLDKIVPFYRVSVNGKEVKVNIFDMAGHPVFYEVQYLLYFMKIFWKIKALFLSIPVLNTHNNLNLFTKWLQKWPLEVNPELFGSQYSNWLPGRIMFTFTSLSSVQNIIHFI